MIRIITVGKISKPYREVFSHYEKMVSRFARLEHVQISTGGDLRRNDPDEIKKREWKKISKYLKGSVVILDRIGKELDSKEFSKMIEGFRSKDSTFVIGGPLGLHDEAFKVADVVVSLSKLKLSHEVAFCVLLEQIFRSFKILSGESYDY